MMTRVTDTEPELITIGVLAKASGLTAGALRFYDDCGLLTPARVDPITGYRYYRTEQRERAALIRRLRTIEVPLEEIATILAGDTATAHRLLDEHVARIAQRAREAATIAESIKKHLEPSHSGEYVTLSAAVLCAAIGQVRQAAATGSEFPVLTGLSLIVNAQATTLTATDRYRLAIRTLPPQDRHGEWARVIDPREIDPMLTHLRDAQEVTLTPAKAGLVVDAHADRREFPPYHCGVIDAQFPDVELLLADLAPVRTRTVLNRDALAHALRTGSDTVDFSIGTDRVTVTDSTGTAHRMTAKTTGESIDLRFQTPTIRPCVDTALGPEIMLDIAAVDQPVVLRSATDGDLTALAMPARTH